MQVVRLLTDGCYSAGEVQVPGSMCATGECGNPGTYAREPERLCTEHRSKSPKALLNSRIAPVIGDDSTVTCFFVSLFPNRYLVTDEIAFLKALAS